MVGTLGSPELLGVGPAVPAVALVSTRSVVKGVPGPPVPWVGNAGLGCVVGDVASTSGVGLVGGTGTVLAVGSVVCVWVVVTTVEDTEVTGWVVVGSRVVFKGLGVDLPVLGTGCPVVTWMVVPCVGAPEVGVGFVVDVLAGVLWVGLGVLVGPLVFMVPAATVMVCGATVATVAVLGDVLAFVLGTSARGVLREESPAVVMGRVCPTDEGPDDAGGTRVLEVTLSVVPSLVVGALPLVQCVVTSAVTLVEFRLAAQVPVVNVTEAGGTVAVLSVGLSALGSVSLGILCFTDLGHILVVTKCRGSSDTIWLLDNCTEEIQTSTRAVHILLVSWKQGWWSLSLSGDQPFRLSTVAFCLAQGSETAAQCRLGGQADVLLGQLWAWHPVPAILSLALQVRAAGQGTPRPWHPLRHM